MHTDIVSQGVQGYPLAFFLNPGEKEIYPVVSGPVEKEKSKSCVHLYGGVRERDKGDEGRSHTNPDWFRGGHVFKAHGLLYHSTLGLRVMKEKKKIS